MIAFVESTARAQGLQRSPLKSTIAALTLAAILGGYTVVAITSSGPSLDGSGYSNPVTTEPAMHGQDVLNVDGRPDVDLEKVISEVEGVWRQKSYWEIEPENPVLKIPVEIPIQFEIRNLELRKNSEQTFIMGEIVFSSPKNPADSLNIYSTGHIGIHKRNTGSLEITFPRVKAPGLNPFAESPYRVRNDLRVYSSRDQIFIDHQETFTLHDTTIPTGSGGNVRGLYEKIESSGNE